MARLDSSKGVIAWFARNPVAANLLMVGLIIGGLAAAFTLKKQMFPQVESTWLSVNIPYRGAAPQEVEEAITIKLEEALASVQGIERTITYSNRGSASARVKVLDSYDPREVLDEVKTAIDGISSFPDGMERPIVTHQRYKQEVMYISLAGDMPQKELKALGEQVYDEIRALPKINITEYYSGANYEIAIEVSQAKLREYGLSFSEVAAAVRDFSTNRSAGEIRADEGYISVRVEEQAYIGPEYENIPIRTLSDGSQLRLHDVATVSDGFEEGVHYAKLDGMNSVIFFVGATKEQSITDISQIVLNYIEERQSTLPQGVTLEPWVDLTYYLNGRLNMMLSNMFYGGLLVFAILSLFLRMRLAFWVMMGLPVSFLGALAFLPLPWIDVSINVASLFAFIMVLGVVVDDAIIIGESVHSEIEERGQTLDNVIRGAQRVAVPATFGVLTTIAAFMPMALETGPNSAMPQAIGFVVVLCLLFSLVESKLILPAHLANMKPEPEVTRNPMIKLRRKVDSGLSRFVDGFYRPFLARALHYRYGVLGIFTGIIIFTIALFASGNMRFLGMPKIPHDFSRIELEMSANSPERAVLDAVTALQSMIEQVEQIIEAEHGQGMVERVLVDVTSRTTANVQAKLVDAELRPMSTFDLSGYWREAMPEIPGLKQLTIIDNLFGGGTNDGDVSFRVISKDEGQLQAAAAQLKEELAEFQGVYEVNDSEKEPSQEAQFTLKPLAYSLGLTPADVANQASYSLFGIEAQRIVRDRQEIRVMVRYPRSERNTLDSVHNVLIRTPAGAEVPLSEIADVEFVESSNQIYREDGNRAITIWGSVDIDETQPLKVANHLRETVFPQLRAQYPRVTIEEAGKLKDERADVTSQIINILVILLPIYVLLALPLKSYTQPLMIMSVIPFGVIGAILGHLILRMDMSMMSVFGIFAVVGVVVNDSLVMVDYVNHARAEGQSLHQAVLNAGQKRFRAILLTSLTTFIGLVPIMSETSLQAQIVIPMAVSLAFGVLFATVVTLILVPCLYVTTADIRPMFARITGREPRTETATHGQ